MTGPLWPARLIPGLRVVVRYRLPSGFTDALGELLSVDARTVVVQTRRGDVRIDLSSVVAAKEVPPPPARRGARQ
jgi:hypothetical protein